VRLAREIGWIACGVGIFGAILTLTTLAAWMLNCRTEKRSKALLRSLLTLRLGESTILDIQRAFDGFEIQNGGGYTPECNGAMTSYDAVVQNFFAFRLVHAVPVLCRFGLNPWGTSASVWVNKQGRVCGLIFGAGFLSADLKTGTEVRSRFSWPDPALPPSHAPPSLAGSWLRGNRYIRIRVSPDDDELARQNAFAFDFSCFRSMSGCKEAEELLPALAQQYRAQQPASNR
jgi:hypothetical protein